MYNNKFNSNNLKKTYIHKNCFSSGNLFMDKLVGGYSIGSTVLLIEDNYSKLYKEFLKYFIGEGMVKNHQNFIFHTNSIYVNELTKNIPYKSTQVESLLNAKKVNENNNSSNNEAIKIAWRYENIKYSNLIDDIAKTSDYIFDISRPIQDKYKKEIIEVNLDNINTNNNNKNKLVKKLENLNKEIVNKVQDFLNKNYVNQENNNEEDKENEENTDIKYVRLVIPSLINEEDLFDFDMNVLSSNDFEELLNNIKTNLMVLKNIARSTNGVVFVTVSGNLKDINSSVKETFNNRTAKILDLFMFFFDYVFSLKSFTLDENKIEDYNGLMYINKIPRISALKMVMHNIEADIYGLLLEKRKLIIEPVDIGIEIDRNTKVKEKDVKNSNVKTKIQINPNDI